MTTNLYSNLDKNHRQLKVQFADCADFTLQPCLTANGKETLVCYFQGLVDEKRLDELLKQIMEKEIGLQPVTFAASSKVITFEDLTDNITLGNPVLMVGGEPHAFAFILPEWEKREIEEPMAESTVRGPREGFNESITTNMALLRKRLRTGDFKLKETRVGRLTKSRVMVGYIQGVCNQDLIDEVMSRLSKIDIDGVLESGNLEGFLEDHPFSPFPQVLSTERPDTVVSSLMEGRVVIMMDGTPFSMVVPTGLASMLQSPEDYYQRFLFSTAVRWLRYAFIFIALLAPSAYVAILTYHHEMVPTTLLLSIARSREEIPFPALIEAFIMEITFEGLREAGVRLPKQVGAAVSIVGALVIGQAATSAGLVSSPMVMVVAITGIASFMLPHFSLGISIRLLRFPIMILSGLLGLLGLLLGLIAIVIHLCSLRSFGTPYLSPIAPYMRTEWKDVLLRSPSWAKSRQPHLTGSKGSSRIAAESCRNREDLP